MLIIPTPDILDDGLLDAKESLERYKENTFKRNEMYRLHDQKQLTNVLAQAGMVMSSDSMVRKIMKLKTKPIWVENSIAYPGACNFYTEFAGTKVCLNAPFKKGKVPEFSILHEDEHGLVVDKTPGWRDVLTRLLEAGVLIKSQIDRAFGIPSSNESATRWFKSTRKFN